ncbi:MAG: DUF3800 domain-containing protein [Acidobacteriota bacterium]
MDVRYRLFFDESGDRSVPSNVPASGYFALCGCVFSMEQYVNEFRSSVETFRKKHFPDHDKEEPVILHREEIKARRGPFAPLQEENRRLAFDEDLLFLLGNSPYRLMTVVLDKRLFFARNGKGADPHARCLWELLDRYSDFLMSIKASGDVMGESRKEREDLPMKETYSYYWNESQRRCGTELPLTSKELKLKPKAHDILGTQLADLLAYPTRQEILSERGLRDEISGFTRRVCDRIGAKYLNGAAIFLDL